MSNIEVRPITDDDREWMAQFIRVEWGSSKVVGHGNVYYPHMLPGFLALRGEEKVGLLTYHIDDDGECEIITINSTLPRQGIGTRLIEATREMALDAGCHRLWLITTNDNLGALGFYQKQGFRMVAIHRDAVEQARRLKPEIPLVGEHGIPIRDEIELAVELNSTAT
jgi:ribosomal protein S18 acetylase RimI-like enzyme